MSARTFARRFKQETGTTPHRWLTHQRILSAQQLLEKSDRPIDWIAESVGLQTAATLREHFRRMLKTTPTFLSALIRRQVVEKWRRYGGSIESNSVVRDSFWKKQLLQPLLVVERGLDPQV
jgi:transcriptional regulator GlxA family with amidase domain